MANHSTNPKHWADNHVYVPTPTVSGERIKSLESHGSSSQLFKSKKMIVQGELMKSLEGHGSSSLPFVMKKVMISHHRSNSHEGMRACIFVLHIRSVVVEDISLQLYRYMVFCNKGNQMIIEENSECRFGIMGCPDFWWMTM